MTESAMGVGMVAVVLVLLVRTGALQWGLDWLKRRAAPSPPPAGGPPSSTSPTEASATLPELARQFKDRKQALDAELKQAAEILKETPP